MRYLGNKIKLLEAIEETIEKYNIQGDIFADLFAGTGSVGDYFKDKYSIISNDFLYYSYVINNAKLSNSKCPNFINFRKKYNMNIFDWLNNKRYDDFEKYFIYEHYTPKGGRMFFTEQNGILIDGIRITIEELYRDELVNENEYFYLLASLIESVTKVSNTSGTYEAYFKFWDSRAEKRFLIEPLEIVECDKIFDNSIFNEDTNKLIRKISGDIAYIDTPYTVTQYVSAYHMLETVAKYDSPSITGVAGKRNRGDKNSLYAQKTKALEAFEDLFRQLNFKHVILSYSNQGLVSLAELTNIAKKFAVKHKVEIDYFDYREYKNHRSSNKGKHLNEVIIYFEKDLTCNKSPLNYSGSKDTLLPLILKELPASFSTFVDVMGGAFNVGANVVATEKVYYNEINPYIYEIIKWLLKTNKESCILEIEDKIKLYSLQNGDKESFLKLRKIYNNSDSSALNLYLLHMYSFQNMIRFNTNLKFNTPVGIAGYSNDIKQRIMNFNVKSPSFVLMNKDYTELEWDKLPKDTVFYFDPPYFISSATYNDGKRGMKGWSGKEEVELLDILTMLDKKGYRFMLSNVIHHKNKTNNLLVKWINEHNFTTVELGISGWRYTKNEVLIKNF